MCGVLLCGYQNQRRKRGGQRKRRPFGYSRRSESGAITCYPDTQLAPGVTDMSLSKPGASYIVTTAIEMSGLLRWLPPSSRRIWEVLLYHVACYVDRKPLHDKLNRGFLPGLIVVLQDLPVLVRDGKAMN